MKKIFFFFASWLFAYQAHITDVNGDIAKIDVYVKKGVSAKVICSYLKEDIICANAISLGKKIKLLPYEELKNPAFATPYVLPKKGDLVIFAKNYDRILIIAPTQSEYLKAKELYKNATIISPDVLAAFIDEFNTKTVKDFAKEFDIGRVIFILDKLYEVDSQSMYVIKTKPFNASKYKKAFFTYYKKFDLEPFKWKIVNAKLQIKE
ncbi:MAG: hypothetical protein GXO62_05840 [Epsilonproteobacteria bacterium]|nr:hypothetical protein [Campylobacterota bacterium]